MRASLFWFSDEQWAKIEALLPSQQPGPKPRNNRRILSGIMHVLKVGCRWQDCPSEYGPYTTVYNRFNRWSGRGIWQQIFEAAAQSPAPEEVALDSTHTKAHRCAGSGKGTGNRHHQGRPQQKASCARR
jgi:transposase